MIKTRISLLGILLLVLFGCEKKETGTETLTQKADETNVADHTLPTLSNDYLVSIYEAQELIKIQQDDIELRRTYCEKAYLPDHRIFVSMGIARLHNPQTGAAIPEHMAEKAARLDAIRWASYGKEWIAHDYKPAFGQLKATFQQDVEVLNKAHVGDSLFVFVATRLQ